MNETYLISKLDLISSRILELERKVSSLRSPETKSDTAIWDNTDIKNRWHVSERTLASWRSKGLVTYSKVGKKIFYSEKDRRSFLNRYRSFTNKDGVNGPRD